MNWVDYGIVGIVVLSSIISLLRGFVKEALSLAAWIIALWIALVFFRDAAALLTPWIDLPSARLAVAFALLFVVVLILGAVANYLVGKLVEKTGLGGTDRMIGIFFGVARGVVIVGLLVLLAGLTALPQDPWWQESRLLGHFEALALWLRDFLPDDIAKNIKFE